MEYSTHAARLATFEPPTKRSKAGWPHKQPSAEKLAEAGFYYSPESTGSDNVECFLCTRRLDGWEKDDNPIQEHLKHSPECAWAILMNITKAKPYDTEDMEDPTNAKMTEARNATFAIGWPHESKRGWLCKIEKMVEAGWHLAPTEGFDDWVTCAYCELSLDGWEPKDNPFDEHYRRAPDCVFFHFAGATAPSKRPKAKKGRASRASRTSRTSKGSTRLSTQSSMSEAPSIPEFDESIDTSTTSVLSTMSTASTATTKGKRKAGGRAKSTKSKKAKTTRPTRGKKAQPEPEHEPEVEAEELEPELEIPQTSQPEPADDLQVDAGESEVDEREPSPTPVPEPPITYPSMPEPEPAEPFAAAAAATASPRYRGVKQAAHNSTEHPSYHSPTPEHKCAIPPTLGTSAPPPQSPSTHSDSDVENAPPSTRSPASRPPIPAFSPAHPEGPVWTAVDVETIFRSTPVEAMFKADVELDEGEKTMTVQEWIEHVAAKAEVELRLEGERIVGVFEREGARAMGVLEGVQCI